MKLVTIKEATEILKITRQTIYTWRKQGKIKGYKLGERLIRLDLEELENLLEGEDNGR